MALIDFDKFLASFITEIKKNHMVITYNIPSCIKKALEDQGLEYKDGEIVKTQDIIAVESEDEKIRKALISFLKSPFVNENITDEKVAPWLAWLEKQGQNKCIEDLTQQEAMDIAVAKCFKQGEQKPIEATWKPSDEQMKALHDMNLTGNISYAGQGQTLIELYNDLKKLKGE